MTNATTACPCCGAAEPDWNGARSDPKWLDQSAEITRLQEAKRRFSDLADERGKESNALRQALTSCESWIELWADHVGACKGGDKCTCGYTAILYEAHAALEPSRVEQKSRPEDFASDNGFC